MNREQTVSKCWMATVLVVVAISTGCNDICDGGNNDQRLVPGGSSGQHIEESSTPPDQVVQQEEPVCERWEMTYSLDDESSEREAGANVWIDVRSDGRVAYNLTVDGADSNFAVKQFTITPDEAEQIRQSVSSAVGDLTFQHPGPDGTLGRGSSLSGCIGGDGLALCAGGYRFQMLIPAGRDPLVRLAFSSVLDHAHRMEWTYDPFHLD